jgi:hypothetical protein
MIWGAGSNPVRQGSSEPDAGFGTVGSTNLWQKNLEAVEVGADKFASIIR